MKTALPPEPAARCGLYRLGYDAHWAALGAEHLGAGLALGRVVAEHRQRYVVAGEHGELDGEVTGHLRHTARGREDFPAVGDWVALARHSAGDCLIHAILPRRSLIARQAAGDGALTQAIAANVDTALLIQAVDRDYKLNRIERYLTLCHAARVGAIVVLGKSDLIDPARLARLCDETRRRIGDTPLVTLSNRTPDGHQELEGRLEKGRTYCLLGSSGVGKSTLINRLGGRQIMRTGAIGEHSQRGRHVTSHRELCVLDSLAILIDNPGMREVGIVDAADGIETTFATLSRLAQDCRFADCRHTGEAGCALLAALESEQIDAAAYASYARMRKETDYLASSLAERRRKDRQFGKQLKNYQKHARNGA